MKPFAIPLVSLALFTAASGQAQTVITDSFESRDLSARYTSGLDWGGTNRTSLVTRDPILGDLIIFNGKGEVEIQEGFEKNWLARDGDVSMRFDFPSGSNSWAEQRFSLDSAHQEIWLSFWLKVPDNYRHSSRSPSNSKLFALWMDGYSSKGLGPSVIWEFWNDGSGGSRLAYHYSPGGYKTANSHKQHTPFIRYPEDQGRWMQVVLHVKAARTTSSDDGVIETYRRWENESQFQLLHKDYGADIGPPSGGPDGWKAGYILGWSNPGYDQPTEFLVDDFKVSRSSLLDTADSPSPSPEPEPEEPAPEPNPGEPGECKAPRIPDIFSS